MIPDLNAICFGDSNAVNNQEQLKHGILSGCKFIPTYYLDQVKNKLHLIGEEDIVIIHVGTNDIAKICQQYFKSDAVKERDLCDLANKYDAMTTKITYKNPRIQIFISMILNRYDSKDQLNLVDGRDIVNFEIQAKLKNKPNVSLISNDMAKKLFLGDKYHLSPPGIEKLRSNWISAIGR